MANDTAQLANVVRAQRALRLAATRLDFRYPPEVRIAAGITDFLAQLGHDARGLDRPLRQLVHVGLNGGQQAPAKPAERRIVEA